MFPTKGNIPEQKKKKNTCKLRTLKVCPPQLGYMFTDVKRCQVFILELDFSLLKDRVWKLAEAAVMFIFFRGYESESDTAV